MRDPVCPLVLALYGHPDAGTCWEKHCDAKLREAGFLPIVNWAGCYRHAMKIIYAARYCRPDLIARNMCTCKKSIQVDYRV